MRPKLFACLILLSAIPALAQDTPKSVRLTDKSNIPAKDILKALRKKCPNVSIANDVTKSDYALEAIKSGKALNKGFDLNLFDRDGITVIASSNGNLRDSVEDVCSAIKTSVIVEVADSENLTQSQDIRGVRGRNVLETVINSATGRRTHTDTSTIYVIVNGEHALLDCYERRTGCTTIGPGKYYGQLKGRSIWVNYEMPLTHKPVRDHYVIKGSW